MQQCLIYDNSLKFSRGTFGTLTLIAFLIHNHWLVLATSLLMVFGIFSIKFNLPYQFYTLVLRKLPKEKAEPIQKESGELSFACSMGGSLLFIGFLFLYFEKFINFAWGLILIVSFLMFLASIANICVASLMYVLLKRFFIKR